MIGHARSDETGKYSGGKAGDQTGKEVGITEWYSRPWNIAMWARDESVREKMAEAMEQACANDNIGYDQGQRTTLYDALRKVGFRMDKVDVPCETDCSALVACCAICAGVSVSKDIYTGNEKNAFQRTGMFEIHTESKYLISDKYIPRGAILLYEGHHTAINLTKGSLWSPLNGWVNRNGKTYYYENGLKYVKKWLKYGGYWYRFGTDGAMLTGWHTIIDDKGNARQAYFETTGDYKGAMYHESDDHQGYLEVWKEK